VEGLLVAALVRPAMSERHLTLLYRDVDRLAYLCALKRCAGVYDLDIELVRHRQVGSEDWGQKLIRGEIDAIAENYWGLQRFRAEGAPLVTVASSAHLWQELLLVRPGIESLIDLRGKKLAVRDHGPQRSFPAVLFGQLSLLDDIEQVVVDEKDLGRWGVWKAVTDGRCDACFMTPAYADAPLAAGLREIHYPPFPFEGGHIIPTTTEAYIAENPATVAALVSAMFDANHRIHAEPEWLLEVVKTDCLDDLREHFTFDDDAAVRRFTDTVAKEIGPLPIPTLLGLRNAVEVARLQYDGLDDFNPLPMWDLSFAREALAARGEPAKV
jgi:hypothetical protein